MPVSLVDPEGLPQVEVYRQVSVATGSRMVFVAGQVAWGAGGSTVGAGDVGLQVEQCYLNVATALAGVEGSFEDVAALTVYVVDWDPGRMPGLLAGIARAKETLGTRAAPPATLVGVAALAAPDLLVEVQAIAVLA